MPATRQRPRFLEKMRGTTLQTTQQPQSGSAYCVLTTLVCAEACKEARGEQALYIPVKYTLHVCPTALSMAFSQKPIILKFFPTPYLQANMVRLRKMFLDMLVFC